MPARFVEPAQILTRFPNIATLNFEIKLIMEKDLLNTIKNKAIAEIQNAPNLDLLEKIGKKYLARNDGELTQILRNLKNLPIEERKTIGRETNEVKVVIERELAARNNALLSVAEAAEDDFDITLPGDKLEIGHLHPLTQFFRKVADFFISMDFEIAEGPEMETEKYNFDLLNIPQDHPARDLWDTFYIDHKVDNQKLLLRTHTSPVQLRAMEKRKPPIKLIAPGRIFRHEATDASHETTFYQLEGLVIDKNIKMTDLIGILKNFTKTIFGPETKIRVRPSFFPFTEPSIEIDMSCAICHGVPSEIPLRGNSSRRRVISQGKSCGVCGGDGWVEILGAGMVHPQVLKNMKVDPEKYTGFAFGMGIDRLMILHYGINDVRLSYSGDLRFIKQF